MPQFLPQRWPWDVRDAADLPEEIQRYLADTETSALGGQVHEAVIFEPVLTTFFGIVGCLWAIGHVPDSAPWLGDILVVSIFVFLLRLAWKWWEWQNNLIFISGKRIIAVYGIIIRQVAMMPLSKLTDMRYERTPMGLVFGYGTFIVESAGQVQALSKLSPIPDPDSSYRHVQNLLFGRATTDVRLVDVTTDKKVRVEWGRGKWTRTEEGTSGTVEQDDEPWWKD